MDQWFLYKQPGTQIVITIPMEEGGKITVNTVDLQASQDKTREILANSLIEITDMLHSARVQARKKYPLLFSNQA